MSITGKQIKFIFALKHQQGISDENLALAVKSLTGRSPEPGHLGLSMMTKHEARKLIDRLQGTAKPQRRRGGPQNLVKPGSQRHRNLLAMLVKARIEAGRMTVEGFGNLCQHTIKKRVPLTSKDVNDMVECLKGMNGRDGLWIPDGTKVRNPVGAENASRVG